jgi:hypothetical protein
MRSPARAHRRRRRGEFKFSNLILFAVVMTALYTANQVIPAYWEFLEMKEVAAEVLFTWKDRGRERADSVFENELNKRELNPDLIQSCNLYDVRTAEQRFMECWWDAEYYTPWGKLVYTQEYYVHRGIDKRGEVFDVETY